MKIMALGDRDASFLTHREVDATLERLAPACVAWTPTDSDEARDLENVDGVWLLPGTPYRDDRSALNAVEHCARTGTPFLGTCGGFQYAALALIRSRAGVAAATHAEVQPDADDLAIVPLQCTLYGQVRTVHPVAGTLLSALCGGDDFEGFHWCGYGIAERFVPVLVDAGVVVSAVAEDAGAAAIELADHPFFLGTSFQPQVGTSERGEVHPIIGAFAEAAAVRSRASR
jgi:CTP synthase (UTP-ammonia lyase)